jgi:hypothetical protein
MPHPALHTQTAGAATLTDAQVALLSLVRSYGDAREDGKTDLAMGWLRDIIASTATAPSAPTGWKSVPIEPTPEMISAMSCSKARDDEGEFPALLDLIDYSGENKTHAVLRAAYAAMLNAAPSAPTDANSAAVVELTKEEADHAIGMLRRNNDAEFVDRVAAVLRGAHLKACNFCLSQAAAPSAQDSAAPSSVRAEPVTVEAVATVRRVDGNTYLDWLIEGGVAAMVEGETLMICAERLTDDTGSGEVYLTNKPQVGVAGTPAFWIDPQTVSDIQDIGFLYNVEIRDKNFSGGGLVPVYLNAPPAPAAAPQAGLPFGIIDPDYATAYTKIRIAAWQYGYAIGLQGSFTRDLDLIAVPWTAMACPAEHLVKQIEYRSGLKRQGPPKEQPHGRRSWSLLFPGFEDPRWVDLSVVALAQPQPGTGSGKS